MDIGRKGGEKKCEDSALVVVVLCVAVVVGLMAVVAALQDEKGDRPLNCIAVGSVLVLGCK